MITDDNFQKVRNDFESLGACVLIPTFNNERTLKQVIDSVLKYTDKIIVVNDGSTDSTSLILSLFPGLTLITFPENKGKGIALREGFKKALEKKFQYAITIDSDGQHFPDDLSKFLEKTRHEPGSLIIGARNMDQDSVPGGSSFGHKISNFSFWFETGIKVPDTQSGFRLYPLNKIKDIKFFTPRFEFEIEVIVKAAWKGVQITSVPVKVYYAKGKERVSHFRKKTDFTRISLLNTWFVLLAIVYYHPKRILKKLRREKIRAYIKKNISDVDEPVTKKSFAVGVGVMTGILPIWGYQMLTALALAFLFRLNKVIVIIAANISIPPMIPFILYGSIKMGEWVTGKKADIFFSSGLTVEMLKKNLFVYVAGSIVLAVFSGIVAGIITYFILRKNDKKIHNQPLF